MEQTQAETKFVSKCCKDELIGYNAPGHPKKGLCKTCTEWTEGVWVKKEEKRPN